MEFVYNVNNFGGVIELNQFRLKMENGHQLNEWTLKAKALLNIVNIVALMSLNSILYDNFRAYERAADCW